MAYGLQVTDASGNLTVRTTDRITRFWGTLSCTLQNLGQQTWLGVDGMTTDGTWAAYCSASQYATAEVINGSVQVTMTMQASSPITIVVTVLRV